jgi:hypothetical protein
MHAYHGVWVLRHLERMHGLPGVTLMEHWVGLVKHFMKGGAYDTFFFKGYIVGRNPLQSRLTESLILLLLLWCCGWFRTRLNERA